MPSIKRKAESAPAKERDVKKSKSGEAKKVKSASAPPKEKQGKRTDLTSSKAVIATVTPTVEGAAFQRGGADLLTPLERKQIRAQASQDVLLEEETGEQQDGLADSEGEALEVDTDNEVNIKKPEKKKRKHSTADFKSKTHRTSKIDGLSFKRIHKGLVVLGCITKIGKRDVTLSLPNNLMGFVPIASLSAGVQRKLAEQEEESSGEEDMLPTRHKMVDTSKLVKVGQYLRATVLSIGNGSKKHIQLSTIPKDVNTGIKAEDLVKHVTVQGEISSIEDHGAIVDLDLASGNIRAFIPPAELGDRTLSTLEIGAPILCAVTSSTSNSKVVKLSASSKYLDSRNSLKTVSDINALQPGTVVDFSVSETDESGIRGRMMDLVDITADVVHSGNLSNLDDNKPQPKLGRKLKARIIFTSVTEDSRVLGVSILPHILALSSTVSPDLEPETSATDTLLISTIVDEMMVKKVDPVRGLLMDVGVKGIPGFAHVSRISDKRVKELSALSGHWREGSIHKGRITAFNPIDGLFLVSLEEKVLELPFLSYEDAQPGQFVLGTVSKYKSHEGEIRGITLKITESTSGLIPASHLSDVQLQFPEKKFKIDSVVRARVLSVDPDQRRITLTCKKTLLNSKAAIWKSYTDVHVGSQSLGTIIAFLPSGALIEFYNHLKAFLPTSEMSESFVKDPKEHFRIGQVVNLRAITVAAEEKRLVVSCRQDSESTADSQKVLEALEIGTIVTAKVSEKLAEEFVLDIENTGIKAILPISHLIDGSDQKCNNAAKHIRVDQTLQDLAVINLNKNKRYIRLTKKSSLIHALKLGKMPSSMKDLTANMELTGFIKNITDIGVFVQFANNMTGLLPKNQLAEMSTESPDFGLRRNQSVTARVSSVDFDQQRFFLTQKAIKEAVANEPRNQKTAGHSPSIVTNPVDGISTDFTLGKLTKAKITGVKDTQLNVKLADDVQGRIDISQIFDTWSSIKHKKQPLKSFQNGHILEVRIMGIHDARNHKFLPITHQRGNPMFELTARPSEQLENAEPRLALANIKLGDSYLCFVNNVRSDHLWVNINTEIRGRINVMELTDDPEEISNLAKHYPVGCALQARVIQVNAAENRLDLSARPVDKARPQVLEDLSVGQVVVSRVSKILEKMVLVQISENISGAIHICDMEDDFSQANTKSLRLGQILPTVVLSIDVEKKDIWLSKRPSKFPDSAIAIKDPELLTIRDVQVNDIRRGFIKNITDQGLFVSLSRDLTAFVRISELFDQFVKNWKANFSLNQLVRGKVIVVKESANQIQMSLKSSVLDAKFVPTITFEDVLIGRTYTGKVRKVEDFGVFVVLDKSQNVSGLCHRSEIADEPVSSVKDLYEEGIAVKVKILKIDKHSKRINLGMKASYFASDDENPDSIATDNEDEDEGSNEDDSDHQMLVLQDADATLSEEDEDDGGVTLSTPNERSRVVDVPSSSDKNRSTALGGLDLGGFDWTGGMADHNSDTEMLDIDDRPATTKKRKHGATLIQVDRTGDLDTHGAQSVSDFERLLMGQPNSSYLWLSYMAFHLQLGEIEKAREIAERALQTINVQSKSTQDESLNVWIGLLNLENSYGNDESIVNIFQRACTHNDPKEVYARLTSIYIQSGKQDKAGTLFEDMIKKFSSDPKVWQNYASFLFDIAEDPIKARALLPRAMQSLPGHTHIDIASKFAQLEYKSAQGDNERGRTIFEGLITNFPKRLDLWNVLLDLEMKHGSKEQVRQLFDRVTTGKLKVQKAKFFFKKWLEYEEKSGDAKSQEKVKAKAAEFVRKHEETKS